MKAFLNILFILFLFNANACEITTNNTPSANNQTIENSSVSQETPTLSTNFSHYNHELVTEIEEEEELHKTKIILSKIFIFYFEFELNSTINTFENFYFSKQIIPATPRYILLEVFRI